MDLYSLIVIVLILALVGFLVHLITTYIPMPGPIQQTIIVVVVVVMVLYLLALVTGHAAILPLRTHG